MSFPSPWPGLVIHYAYLWKREQEDGREEGTKDRPCVILSVVDEDSEREVLVLPLTHTPPENPTDAIEIPIQTKNRLGLDFDRSWIMITEANEFVWPGPDLRPIAGHDESTIAYGALPPRFFAHVRNRFLERDNEEKSRHVKRTE